MAERKEMGKILKQENITKYTTICFCFIAILVRIYFYYYHFTHEDDIAVSYYLRGVGSGTLKELYNRIMNFGWTYAPLQIFMSYPLVDISNNYQYILVLGRFWSFISGIINVFLVYKLASKVLPSCYGVLAAIIMACSWENIIYSSQMEPYEIALTFVMLDFFLLHYFECKKRGVKFYIIQTIICTLACWTQYQLFVVTAMLYLTELLIVLLDKQTRNELFEYIKLFVSGVIAVIMCVPLLLVSLSNSNNMATRGLNWNKGIGGLFEFDLSDGGILYLIKYVISFFVRNIILIFDYFTLSGGNLLTLLLAIVLVFISVYGLYMLVKNKNSFGIFSLSILLSFFLLVIMKKYSLGPSRHALILFPVITLSFVYGLKKMLDDRVKNNNIVVFGVSAVIFLLFITQVPKEISNRQNLLLSSKLEDTLKEYNVDYVFAYGRSFDFRIMDIDGYKYIADSFKKENDYKGEIFAFYSRSKELTENDFSECMSQLEDKDYNWEDREIVSSMSIDNETEVEYASKYYDNWKNGFHLYIIRFNS